MSAETLGGDLLREVKEESLDVLLRSFRELELPSHAPLGFPPLDSLLNVFQNRSVSRQQLPLQNHAQRPTQHQASQPTSDKPPPVIEITGATACSGKTQLLYHLVSLSLLPPTCQDVRINGKGHAVTLFDLSSQFSVLRLEHVMRNIVSSSCYTAGAALPDQDMSLMLSDSLAHLHVFRPESSLSLLTTLDALAAYLLAHPPSHLSARRPLGLLAIHNLSAFLWQDRQEADEDSDLTTMSAAEKSNSSLLLQRYRSLVASLHTVQQLFSCVIIATNWGLAPVTFVAGQPALRPHLPSSWNNFCTVKVIVERHRVSRFSPGMSIEAARRERSQRWEAVEKSGSLVWVNWWGCEGWREEVKEGVRALERGGSFWFRVTEYGISFERVED